MKTLRLAFVVASAATALSACGTAPLSFLEENQVYDRQIMNRYPLEVVAIDGSSPYTRHSIPIAPGEHQLVLGAPSVAGLTDEVKKTVSFSVAPCTRYYLAAQRVNRLSQPWDLVVERVEPVGGCSPDTEMKKASAANGPAGSSLVVGSPG